MPGWGTTITARFPLSPSGTSDAHPLAGLNPREVQVLDDLTRGRRNRQIAERLHISEHTVKYHVANILEKLGVGSRGEAAALARELGPLAPHRVLTSGPAREHRRTRAGGPAGIRAPALVLHGAEDPMRRGRWSEASRAPEATSRCGAVRVPPWRRRVRR